MSARVHECAGGGLMFAVEAWTLDVCEHGGCESCPTGDQGQMAAVVTFFWNAGVAIALAAAAQDAKVSRPITDRHNYRHRQIEKLRHALDGFLADAPQIQALAAEADVMHREVARLRAALGGIAALNIGIASDAARRALSL